MQYRLSLFIMLFTLTFSCKEAVLAQNQQLLDSLSNVVLTTNNDSNRVVALLKLGDLYEYTIPDTALLYYQQALQVAEKTKALNLMAKCSKYLGITYYYQGSYEKALHYYTQSLSTYKEIDYKKGIAACYTNIGLVYEEQSANVKAIASYLKALAMYEKMNYRKGIYSAYINIGGFYFSQEAYKDALDYFLKSLDIAKELKDKAAMADAYNNLGSVYSFWEDKDQSLSYYLKSLAIKKELDDIVGISSSYLNIGAYYFDKGAYKQALSYYLDALKIAEDLGVKQETSTSYINLTSLYSTLADSVASNQNERITYFNQALNYANKAHALALQIGAIPTQNHISEMLMNIYSKLGRYKKATEFAALYIATKDSLLNEEQTKAIAKLEAKYEYQKQADMDSIAYANEIAIKDQRLLREKEVSRVKIITFIIVGAILLLVAMTIISLQRGRIKQNEKIAKQEKELVKANLTNIELENKSLLYELEYKHKEIVNLALHIVEKNEFLKNLQKLLNASSNSINGKNLKKLIDQNLSIEKNREEFNANIESLNDSFFLKLNDKYPKLSKNDKRLCALLRLNLSSKEIASIQNISPNSVDVNRYRLRKKLALDSDTDLSEFLNNFI